jgi:hypothetical protein
MALKPKISTLRKGGADREFESLLRETSEFLTIRKPRLVKKEEQIRRTSAA